MSTAELAGSIRQPEVLLRFNPRAAHPRNPRLTLLEWVKSLPRATWDAGRTLWVATSLGQRPDQVLADAGFEVILPEQGELAAVTSLEQLYMPVTMLAGNGRTVLIRPRLAGYDQTQSLIGGGGVWDKDRQILRLPVSDVFHGASARPGVLWDEASVQRAREVHSLTPLLSESLAVPASRLSTAVDLPSAAADIRAVQSVLGGPVGAFGVDLYPYQVIGAYGVAAGHTLLADSPGVGKTLTSLAAATALRAKRLVIVCPPVVLTNWARETQRSGFVERALGGAPAPLNKRDVFPGIALFKTGRKAPALDERIAVAVISDSRLASQPEIARDLAHWLAGAGAGAGEGAPATQALPQNTPAAKSVIVYDEALDVDTPILTTDGWSSIGEIRPGQFVYGSSGRPTRVMRTTAVVDGDCFAVAFNDGSKIVTDAGHKWKVEESKRRGPFRERTVTTREIGASMDSTWRLPEVLPVQHPKAELPLHPYVLGVWLGDGAATQPHMAVHRERLADFLEAVREFWPDTRVIRTSSSKAARITFAEPHAQKGRPARFTRLAKELGIWGDKHIPERYLLADEAQRMWLLRGLMDTDGYASVVRGKARNVFTFTNANRRLIDDAVYLIRSLGLVPKVSLNKNYHRGGEKDCWRVSFSAKPGMRLFHARNRGFPEFTVAPRAVRKYVVSVEPIASRKVRCIEVAAENHLFLAGRELIPTHNCHRMKSMGSQRSEAMLDLTSRAPRARAIALTGTPVLAGPHELVPILEFTGHLAPVFGGAGPFLTKYCRQDRYRKWHPRKAALKDLNQQLNQHVWVRRTKEQVLPQLPQSFIVDVVLDVPLTEYNRTHKQVLADITEWVVAFRAKHGRLPTEEEQEEYAENSLRYSSQLLQAAGLCKVPTAIEMLTDHLSDAPDEPIILWAHHKEVIAALRKATEAAGVRCGVIDGTTSDNERMRNVDDFQAGKLPVLICSITAAGVGITLTRGHEALFVESNWTPALMRQAIDRQHRLGQTSQVTARVLMASGTLDEHVQAKLAEKGETVSSILGDTSNVVAVAGDRPLIGPRDIVTALIRQAVSSVK